MHYLGLWRRSSTSATAIVPPAVPAPVEVVSAVVVTLVACFCGSGLLALVHGSAVGLLVYSVRQGQKLWEMKRELESHPLDPHGWSYQALAAAVRQVHVGWRTSREDVQEALRECGEQHASQLSQRWWCCLGACVLLTLVGFALSCGNVARQGDLLPRNALFSPLTASWLELTVVVFTVCLNYGLGEIIFREWRHRMFVLAEPRSALIRQIVAAPVGAGEPLPTDGDEAGGVPAEQAVAAYDQPQPMVSAAAKVNAPVPKSAVGATISTAGAAGEPSPQVTEQPRQIESETERFPQLGG